MPRKTDAADNMNNGKSNFKEYRRKGEDKAGDKADKPARKRTALKSDNDEPIKKSVTRSQKNSIGRPPVRTEEGAGEKRPYEKKQHDRPFTRSTDSKSESTTESRGEWKKPYTKSEGDRPYKKNTEGRTERTGDKGAWKKPYAQSEGDRPYKKKAEEGSTGEWKKPFAKSEGDKPYKRNTDDKPERGGDKKEWKKPFAKSAGDKPYKRNTDDKPERGGDKKEWKKPYAKSDGDKPAYKKKVASGDEGSERKTSSRFGKRPYQKKEVEDDGTPNPFTRAPKITKRQAEDALDTRSERAKERAKEIETGLQSTRHPSATRTKKDAEAEIMPLNKFIAHSGVCSRRDAAILVKEGKVTINGVVITDPGHKVTTTDEVVYDQKKLIPQKGMVYILLNKPKDYITTTDDPQGRKTVMELLMGQEADRLFPVGRLDRNTTGLLLITNDGALTQKLSHPSYQIKKIYQATLDKPLTKADFEKIMAGLELEDGKAIVDTMAYLDTKNELGLEIHSGRNRIVRRIFESLGYEVVKLDRVMYAGLTKKNLPRGKWRYLNEREVVLLKHFKS